MSARFIVGDVHEVMATIPDGSVDLVLTSPPFLALRSYLPADHEHKHLEIGSEPTPAAFLDTLLALTAEWRRVLAPHGSICVELGDTYSGSGGAGGDYADGGWREGQQQYRAAGWAGWDKKDASSPHYYRKADGTEHLPRAPRGGGNGWPMPKSLCMIPALYSASLAYGRNLLTGEPSPAGQWRVRNIVRWCRPNPPVGALGDKFRPATSEMTIACVSGSRYFDLDAVREPLKHPDKTATAGFREDGSRRIASVTYDAKKDSAGAPPLDWWEIPTQPYKGAHYATWPDDLLTRPIKAMVPQRVCTTCGEPSRRIVEKEIVGPYANNPEWMRHREASQPGGLAGPGWNTRSVSTTLGWTDCGHDTWRTGLVLDPFGGSGTSAAVAVGHGRDCILIDIDERNALLAEERLGMFLTVEVHNGEAVA